MPDANTQFLLDLKERIEEGEKELIRSEEKLNILKKRLKEKFECSSIEEAEKKLQSIKKEWEEKDKKLNRLVDSIGSKNNENLLKI
jgi:hypothetical protein